MSTTHNTTPSAEPRTEANTPVPGPGSWQWDQAAGCWRDIYPQAEPAPELEPAPE